MQPSGLCLLMNLNPWHEGALTATTDFVHLLALQPCATLMMLELPLGEQCACDLPSTVSGLVPPAVGRAATYPPRCWIVGVSIPEQTGGLPLKKVALQVVKAVPRLSQGRKPSALHFQ